jgi:phosphoglycerate dehydrogenase-like enzyme
MGQTTDKKEQPIKKKGAFILHRESFEKIYGAEGLERAGEHLDIVTPPLTAAEAVGRLTALSEVAVILSGWGAPKMDAEFLKALPKLEAVFYGAGSVRGFVTDEFWERGITLTSSWGANAIPVVEYTLSQVLFALKRGWYFVLRHKETGEPVQKVLVAGAYGSTVGIVSLGMIGRMMCEHLSRFDVNVIAFDPFVDEFEMKRLGAEKCSLDDLFRRSDVVSLHTPWLPETVGLIEGRHFEMMKPGSTFINTARGAVIREEEMLDVLERRPDLYAVLDVTYPEPPRPDSRIHRLGNVVWTPHIAGSQDGECRRMGEYVFRMLEEYLAGRPLEWRVTKEMAARMA